MLFIHIVLYLLTLIELLSAFSLYIYISMYSFLLIAPEIYWTAAK